MGSELVRFSPVVENTLDIGEINVNFLRQTSTESAPHFIEIYFTPKRYRIICTNG